MSKKQFIALANSIRIANQSGTKPVFSPASIDILADFCARENPAFKRDRWLDYIAGKCGSNGGAIKSRPLHPRPSSPRVASWSGQTRPQTINQT